jgi:hypothetical protein
LQVFGDSKSTTKVINYRVPLELPTTQISKGEHHMKKLIIFSAVVATLLTGCKTQQQTSGYNYDDVYSTKSEKTRAAAKPKIQNEDLTGSQQTSITDTSSSHLAPAATEDYSSNSYEARIKRFNSTTSGLDYNSGYYTGSSDSIMSGGSSPNVNLYIGSSWGSPFYGSSFSFGYGYGYGWDDWGFGFGYPYGYYPYYSWYYPYYWGYPYSYYPYCCGCYYDYPYWGNSYGNYGNNGYYYGQRRSLSSTDGSRNTRTRSTAVSPVAGQDRNTRTTDPGVSSRTTDQTRSGRTTDINRVPPDKQRYTYTRTPNQQNTRVVRNNPGTRTHTDRSYVQRQEPAPKYVRPGAQQQGKRTDAQTYSSPAYRQPKSSQEYINPRSQQGRPSGVTDNSGKTRTYSNPSSSGKRYASPPSSGGNSRSYSNPSGGSHNYSAPSRSSSSPSYSSPSRSSSPSYSAPSRSSSPSGSGGSSGGGGGGRRR